MFLAVCILLPAVSADCKPASLASLQWGMALSLLLSSNKDSFEQLPHKQNISLHPGHSPSPANPHLVDWSGPPCLAAVAAVAEECLAPDVSLPVFSLSLAQELHSLKWVSGALGRGFCSCFALSPPRTREHFCCAKRRRRRRREGVCVHIWALLEAGGELNAGYKRLRNAPVWGETKESQNPRTAGDHPGQGRVTWNR